MLLLSIAFYVQLIAQDFNTKATKFFASIKQSSPYKSASGQWVKELCCFESEQQTSLVFTAPDMNKNGENPDTSFNNVYPNNMTIQAWKMLASNKAQQEISLLFGIPNNYDVTQSSTITLYLLIQGKEETATANIEIALDTKTNNQLLGPNFAATLSTGNFVVTEPTDAKDVAVLVVQATIPPLTLSPKSLLTLIFSRIAPTNNQVEYEKNIYLESVVITYQIKDV